ncbi:Glycogen synthase [uncultured Clostridium sp.]|nr:Glycogen synthase [uncultured Clostridium sp.]SCJ09503.1 Glycogen synthase [uncultured Clostridium sp.]
MKVLHVLDSFNIGGAENLVTNYILETKDKQVNDAIILFKSNSFLREKLEYERINIVDLSDYNILIKLIKLIKFVKKEKYDIVHAHLFPAFYLCAISSVFTRDTKYIMTEHSVTNKRRNKKYFKTIEKFIYKRFDKVIACAEEVNINLRNWLDNEIDIKTVRNGVKNSPLKKYKYEYDLILIGSLRSNVKGVDLLLKSLSQIRNKFKKAVIVGDGIEKENLIKLRNSLELSEKVEFLGIRSDIEYLLDKSKIFVMPSRYEGLPIALLEAMSRKKAIIASNVSCIPDILDYGECGIVIEPENIRELSKAIKELLGDDERISLLGNNAYKKFIDNYSLEIYCNEIDKIYRTVVK